MSPPPVLGDQLISTKITFFKKLPAVLTLLFFFFNNYKNNVYFVKKKTTSEYTTNCKEENWDSTVDS